MSGAMIGELLEREHRKRERNWDPALRWKVIQDTITWAEAQIGRNTPLACKEKERRILDGNARRRSNSF